MDTPLGKRIKTEKISGQEAPNSVREVKGACIVIVMMMMMMMMMMTMMMMIMICTNFIVFLIFGINISSSLSSWFVLFPECIAKGSRFTVWGSGGGDVFA